MHIERNGIANTQVLQSTPILNSEITKINLYAIDQRRFQALAWRHLRDR